MPPSFFSTRSIIIAIGCAAAACGSGGPDEIGAPSDSHSASQELAAATDCLVDVQGDCHGWITPGVWFHDAYAGSNVNAAACLARADEYQAWCGLGIPGDQVTAAFVSGPTTLNAHVTRLDFQFEGFGPTELGYGYNWAPILPTPVPNIWITASRIDPHALPLGNQKLVTDAARKGWVFVCDPMMFQQPNGFDNRLPVGPWVDQTAQTINITRKLSVQGATWHSDAHFEAFPIGTQRLITSNGLPVGVPTGNFPVSASDPAHVYDSNPNAITTQTISFSIPRFPSMQSQPSCTYKEVGITLDGVPLHGPLGDTGNDEIGVTLQDSCGGLSQPGGGYHRHFLSNCTPHMRERAALVGYALDGFGIYSPYDLDGRELTSADLDECHGMMSWVQWEGQSVFTYHYVMTRDFPYTVSCFRGKPTRNAFPPLPGAPPQTK